MKHDTIMYLSFVGMLFFAWVLYVTQNGYM
jgi:hypothetical protein